MMGNSPTKENRRKTSNENKKWDETTSTNTDERTCDDTRNCKEDIKAQNKETRKMKASFNLEKASVYDKFKSLRSSKVHQSPTPDIKIKNKMETSNVLQQDQLTNGSITKMRLKSPHRKRKDDQFPKKEHISLHEKLKRKLNVVRRKNTTKPQITEKLKQDEFTMNAEEKVKAFFEQNCKWTTLHWYEDLDSGESLISANPVLWKIHQRAKALQRHICKPRTSLIESEKQMMSFENENTNDKLCQTDIRPEYWINRKTTVRYGNNFINVVSATMATEEIVEERYKKKKHDALVSAQISSIRLAVLGVLGRSGYAETTKKKLKRELPNFDVSKHKSKVMALCREQVDSFTDKFEEEMGILPHEEDVFKDKLRIYVISIAKPFMLYAQHALDDESNHNKEKIEPKLPTQIPELNEIRTEIVEKHNKKLNSIVKEIKDDAEQRRVGDSSHHTKTSEVNKIQHGCGDTIEHERRPSDHENIKYFLKKKEEKTFECDINPVGPFARGTHYRTDGEIAIEKCKKGSRKGFTEKPKKLKTRGIANKHLHHNPNNIDSISECSGKEESRDSHISDEVCESVNSNCNSDEGIIEDFEFALFAHIDSVMNSEEVKETADMRHLNEKPAQVITGKKNDCDLLKEKYAPRVNKKRQKGDRRNRQRNNSKQATLQFGLNANNSADNQDDTWYSYDEQDEETYFSRQPTILYADSPLTDEHSVDCLFPSVLTFSPRPLPDHTQFM
ncbi:MYH1s [Mytilus edulis]|uniref:MYH1s n=1 Tax=Mytilus edulis TaxID=6550 RepID=A0A8S3R7R2_MYTED|nr:MYH1s [Mytilus edulis]